MNLYLRKLPEGLPFGVLRDIRNALRLVDPSASAVPQAIDIVEAFRRDGYALLAQGDPLDLARITEAIEEAGGKAYAVPESEDEATQRRWRTERMTKGGATPEEVFAAEAPGKPQPKVEAEGGYSEAAYATALAALSICDGHPGNAALHLHTLGRTTGDASVYHDSIRVIGHVFPWMVPIKNSGMWPDA